MFLRNHDELTLEMVTDEERDYMYRAYAAENQMRLNLGIRRRLAPLVGNDRKKMELLNGLLFCMPGTPVLYYGDEIGMGDNVFLGDRNGVRTPMQWSADRNAGFSRANPQRLILPINIDPEYHYEALNVEAQQSNPNSLLWWTKRLIALRKRYRGFSRGSVDFLHPSNPKVLAFVRRYTPAPGEDGETPETILVVANLSRHVQYVELDLSAMKGMIPVELMGRTKFPAVGDLPYLLTLGGHDFYWFSLEAPRDGVEDRRSLVGPVTLVCGSVDALLFGDERSLLEDALPQFLHGRGLAPSTLTSVRVVETAKIVGGDAPVAYVFIRVEHLESEPETFAIPFQVVSEAPPGAAVVAAILAGGATTPVYLVEGMTPAATRLLVEAAARGQSFSVGENRICGGLVGTSTIDAGALKDSRVLATDGAGASIVYDESMVLKLLYRMEEGTAPELELGRLFQSGRPSILPPPAPLSSASLTSGLRETPRPITPRVYGFLERRAPRSEPVTLAIVEEYVVHEGTAWGQARSEVGRLYDRAVAREHDAPIPGLPSSSLVELAMLEPPAPHREVIGSYRDWAALLGRRTAELHKALSASSDPAFAPNAYSPMDQRSKYQSGRNLVGRVLASLRRAVEANQLPANARAAAARLATEEDMLLAKFEPIRSTKIEAKQIRCHGDLHLGRMLFTGKDYVVLGVGAGRDRRLSERRRKRGALRDVATMILSFHWAAAMTRAALRREDQGRAETWGWIWQSWAAAAYLRSYLETAKDAPFVPSGPMLPALLDAALIEKSFSELRGELAHHPERAWIPIHAALRLLGLEAPPI
jgi:maltose alpha-D-glucosyltransferase/alpha-amylase